MVNTALMVADQACLPFTKGKPVGAIQTVADARSATWRDRQWFDSCVSNHRRYVQMDQFVEIFEWLTRSIRSMARYSNVSVEPPARPLFHPASWEALSTAPIEPAADN